MLTRPIQSLIKYAKYVPQVSTSQKIGGLRFYNQSSVVENELIIGGLVVAGGAVTLQYALAAYKQYQANKAANPKPVEEAEEAKSKKETSTKAKQSATGSAAGAKSSANAKPSPFATWFARNFYDGGFEEKMTRREAALILGIRESASPEKIKEAHRRILLLNHPDRGGSAHIAAKINEAKDLLMKGK